MHKTFLDKLNCYLDTQEYSQAQVEQFGRYLGLLQKWANTHNLTAILEIDKMVTHHILDSLSVLPYLSKGIIMDVGTGAGLPGIPLAIALPEQKIFLIDSKQKKLNFVQHVVRSLMLTNVTVVGSRVESYKPECVPVTIVSRAFASLQGFVDRSIHLGDSDTHFIAMKGRLEQARQEIEVLTTNVSVMHMSSVLVPGLLAERCLVIMKKS